MTIPASRLPARFPIGSKYVIEGRGGGDGNLRVFLRYIVLPDGRRIDLPADFTRPSRQLTRLGRRRTNSTKVRRSSPPTRPLQKNRS
jgi:hypothetical protein